MFLRFWFFLTLVFLALLVGMTFAHTLEMPPKLKVDGPLWMQFQHTLYRYFAYVGAPAEIFAMVAALILCLLLRHDRPARLLAITGTVSLAMAFFAIWLTLTRAVNSETARWTVATIPPDWMRWRTQWELSHAARFALHLIAFCAISWAALMQMQSVRPA